MKKWQFSRKTIVVVVFSFIATLSFAQDPTDSLPLDPGAIAVFTVQNLDFGAFYPGSTGGTVTISEMELRSFTGDVIGINQGISFSAAIFEVEAPAGTILNIINGADAVLSGSNGGSMTLHIDDSDPLFPFTTTVVPPGRTQVNIGATLSVGNLGANQPGNYSGSFSITFFQE